MFVTVRISSHDLQKHGNPTSDKLSAQLVAIESPLDERRRNKQK